MSYVLVIAATPPKGKYLRKWRFRLATYFCGRFGNHIRDVTHWKPIMPPVSTPPIAAPTTNSDLERHKKEPGQEG